MENIEVLDAVIIIEEDHVPFAAFAYDMVKSAQAKDLAKWIERMRLTFWKGNAVERG